MTPTLVAMVCTSLASVDVSKDASFSSQGDPIEGRTASYANKVQTPRLWADEWQSSQTDDEHRGDFMIGDFRSSTIREEPDLTFGKDAFYGSASTMPAKVLIQTHDEGWNVIETTIVTPVKDVANFLDNLKLESNTTISSDGELHDSTFSTESDLSNFRSEDDEIGSEYELENFEMTHLMTHLLLLSTERDQFKNESNCCAQENHCRTNDLGGECDEEEKVDSFIKMHIQPPGRNENLRDERDNEEKVDSCSSTLYQHPGHTEDLAGECEKDENIDSFISMFCHPAGHTQAVSITIISYVHGGLSAGDRRIGTPAEVEVKLSRESYNCNDVCLPEELTNDEASVVDDKSEKGSLPNDACRVDVASSMKTLESFIYDYGVTEKVNDFIERMQDASRSIAAHNDSGTTSSLSENAVVTKLSCALISLNAAVFPKLLSENAMGQLEKAQSSEKPNLPSSDSNRIPNGSRNRSKLASNNAEVKSACVSTNEFESILETMRDEVVEEAESELDASLCTEESWSDSSWQRPSPQVLGVFSLSDSSWQRPTPLALGVFTDYDTESDESLTDGSWQKRVYHPLRQHPTFDETDTSVSTEQDVSVVVDVVCPHDVEVEVYLDGPEGARFMAIEYSRHQDAKWHRRGALAYVIDLMRSELHDMTNDARYLLGRSYN